MVDQDPLPQLDARPRSRCWATRRTRWCRAARTAPARRSSTRASSPARCSKLGVGTEALEAYDRVRVKATTDVVLTNRSNPPDAILREVFERSGGKRFERLEEIVTREELQAISDNYKRVAGYDPAALKARPSYL